MTRRDILLGAAVQIGARAAQTADVGATMARAAKEFRAGLAPEQRAEAQFALPDEERFHWHYIPMPRKGLPFARMDAKQRRLAEALLKAGLSGAGYTKAETIFRLEDILRELENDNRQVRDPLKYYFSIFGAPSGGEPWGYRIEGHHLSLNFTLAGGTIAAAPTFLGANPAEVRHGPKKGLRTLAREEDLARAFMESLNGDQRLAAIVDREACHDILTAASRKAALAGQPNGLPAAGLQPGQRQLLDNIVAEYATNLAGDLALARMERAKAAANTLCFAWAGGLERGRPHYYRIQAPSFLIEYDNTQNDANHIHSVWRDFQSDFGLDLLERHYEDHPHS